MRKFSVQLDERCHQLLWRRGGKTWRSRLMGGRLTERLHYVFCIPWNDNQAIKGATIATSKRTVTLLIPDKLAPKRRHEVSWLFEQDVPEGLVKELTSIQRKPWMAKDHPNDPAPASRKRRRRGAPPFVLKTPKAPSVTEETANA